MQYTFRVILNRIRFYLFLLGGFLGIEIPLLVFTYFRYFPTYRHYIWILTIGVGLSTAGIVYYIIDQIIDEDYRVKILFDQNMYSEPKRNTHHTPQPQKTAARIAALSHTSVSVHERSKKALADAAVTPVSAKNITPLPKKPTTGTQSISPEIRTSAHMMKPAPAQHDRQQQTPSPQKAAGHSPAQTIAPKPNAQPLQQTTIHKQTPAGIKASATEQQHTSPLRSNIRDSINTMHKKPRIDVVDKKPNTAPVKPPMIEKRIITAARKTIAPIPKNNQSQTVLKKQHPPLLQSKPRTITMTQPLPIPALPKNTVSPTQQSASESEQIRKKLNHSLSRLHKVTNRLKNTSIMGVAHEKA